MLASDGANPEFVGAHNPDRALAVNFYVRAIRDEFESSKQNRPIFRDVTYVKITTPGIPILNEVDTPMREEHKRRFPQQWAYFSSSQADASAIGTPVSEWSFLGKAQAEELKAMKFFTVEMIANSSDQQIMSIGMMGGMAPIALRQRAREYLANASGAAREQHLASELAKRDERIAAMEKQIGLMASDAKPIEDKTLHVSKKVPA